MPRKRINRMRTKLAKGIAMGMSVSEASRYAGYTHYQAGHLALKGMRKQMAELLDTMHRPIEKVLRKVLLPGLEAKRIIHVIQGGIVMETREVVDHEQRGSFFDRYCKLLGLYGNGHEADSGGGEGDRVPRVSFTVAFDTPESAKAFVELRSARTPDHKLIEVDATSHEDDGPTESEPEL